MLYSCCSQTSVNLEGKNSCSKRTTLCTPGPAPSPDPSPAPGPTAAPLPARLAQAVAAPHWAPSTNTAPLPNQGGPSSLSHLFLPSIYWKHVCLEGRVNPFSHRALRPFSQETCSWNYILLQINKTLLKLGSESEVAGFLGSTLSPVWSLSAPESCC